MAGFGAPSGSPKPTAGLSNCNPTQLMGARGGTHLLREEGVSGSRRGGKFELGGTDFLG